MSRGLFRNLVVGWTSDGEVSRGWFRLLVFDVSRGRIRNLTFDVQKLDWTSGGEVSRGRFRFLCVYDFGVLHQVRKALRKSRRESYCKGGVTRGREGRHFLKVCSIRKR